MGIHDSSPFTFTQNMLPKSELQKQLFKIAALSGASSIALGAWGAHKIKDSKQLVDYRTANHYHILHSIALMLASKLESKVPAKLFLSGMFLFCVPLYRLSASRGISKVENGLMSFAEPVGGALLIGAWLATALFD